MTAREYLRRPPTSGSSRGAALRRIAVVLVVLLAFALIETTASVQVTRLTRDIRAQRNVIAELESDISFQVREAASWQGRAVGLSRLERHEGFVTPDSGRVVLVRVRGGDGTIGSGARATGEVSK